MFWLSALTLIGSAPIALTAPVEGDHLIFVDKAPPADAVEPIPEAFLSYSVEFAFFPDFAGELLVLKSMKCHLTEKGNLSRPNEFSNNLLDNLAHLQGTKPYVRVGGNTQDKSLYQHDLVAGIDSVYNYAVSKDYPASSRIGPSFFESYQTFPNTKFIHGFNWGHAGNSTEGWENVLESAKAACQGIGGDRLWSWEYGNEPDTYAEWWGYRDNATWTEEALAAEWLDHIPKVKAEMAKACPDLADSDRYGFIVPSYTPIEYLDPVLTWQAGLNKSPDVRAFSQHKYVQSSP